jgi:hypothetical protein
VGVTILVGEVDLRVAECDCGCEGGGVSVCLCLRV